LARARQSGRAEVKSVEHDVCDDHQADENEQSVSVSSSSSAEPLRGSECAGVLAGHKFRPVRDLTPY